MSQPFIRDVTPSGIVVQHGDTFIVAPLPFELPEVHSQFNYNDETSVCSWLNEDESADSEVITEEQLDDALAYEPPAPTPTVPEEITPRQFGIIAYSVLGLKESDILAVIAMIPDATQRELAQIDYKKASTFRRDWPLLNSMAAQMTPTVTSEQLDQMWIAGSKL